MDGRGLVRSMKVFGSVRGLRTVRAAWRRHHADARALPPRGAELTPYRMSCARMVTKAVKDRG
ncbi:hypothetical protein, partial [Streptomyces sp. NPDC001919]